MILSEGPDKDIKGVKSKSKYNSGRIILLVKFVLQYMDRELKVMLLIFIGIELDIMCLPTGMGMLLFL